MKRALLAGMESGMTPPTGSCVIVCASANGNPCVLPSATRVLKLIHGSSPPFALLGATLYCRASRSNGLPAFS